MTQPRDYQRATVNPISTLPVYDGELGARLTADGTAFTVWAPTAEAVTLRLFATGSDDEPGARAIAERPMASGPRGTWHVEIPEWLAGVYYDFLVAFPDGTVNRVADPWARAAGVNGARSMVVDLAQTDPEGWDEDRGPEIPDGELVVWETHIGDFERVLQLPEETFSDCKGKAETLAGLMLEIHRNFLQQGESVTAHDIRFTVHTLDGHRIEKIEVTLPEQ